MATSHDRECGLLDQHAQTIANIVKESPHEDARLGQYHRVLFSYQFAIGGVSVHRCWPSGSEDRRVHWLSFNFLQPSLATSTLYPLLVLPSLSLVSTSTFSNMSTDQSLPLGSTVSTLASNRVILSLGNGIDKLLPGIFSVGILEVEIRSQYPLDPVHVHCQTRFTVLGVTDLNRFSQLKC
jgi:hypothetical protein